MSYAELVQQLHYNPKDGDAVKPTTVMTMPFVSLSVGKFSVVDHRPDTQVCPIFLPPRNLPHLDTSSPPGTSDGWALSDTQRPITVEYGSSMHYTASSRPAVSRAAPPPPSCPRAQPRPARPPPTTAHRVCLYCCCCPSPPPLLHFNPALPATPPATARPLPLLLLLPPARRRCFGGDC